jgi:phenylacetate-CoA ligase
MSELVTAAGECCEGQLHLWPEVAFIEVANEMGGEGDSRAGDLLGTGLLNIDMPLIRYRVGDRVTLSGTGETCRCGRRLPLLSSVDGRLDDILFTADGRHIGRLDPVFKAQLPIREAQIVQEALDRIKVRYVPTADFKPAASRLIVERLRARLGRVEVIMERVDTVPRTANGKFRAVVCNLSPELKASLMKGRAPGRKTTDVT